MTIRERRRISAPRPPHVLFARRPVPYREASAFMDARVAEIARGDADECLWFLEHPHLHTAGTGTDPRDLDRARADGLTVHQSGRGGKLTYLGPGQRVVYMMLDVRRRAPDVRAFVGRAERWIVRALANLGIAAGTRRGRIGVWVPRPDKGANREDKIAAVGLRIRHGISLHGLSVNVRPDLTRFLQIVPCGIADQGVTSFADLGRRTTMAELDDALLNAFEESFSFDVSFPLRKSAADPMDACASAARIHGAPQIRNDVSSIDESGR